MINHREEQIKLLSKQLKLPTFANYTDILRQTKPVKVISDRSERSSTIVTTNLPFSRWIELFENNTLVSALVDRLTFRSHVLDMSGPSYRLLTAQASANQ